MRTLFQENNVMTDMNRDDAIALFEHLSPLPIRRIEEIAQATGVNRETAKSRLRYAVAKLREGMQQSG